MNRKAGESGKAFCNKTQLDKGAKNWNEMSNLLSIKKIGKWMLRMKEVILNKCKLWKNKQFIIK